MGSVTDSPCGYLQSPLSLRGQADTFSLQSLQEAKLITCGPKLPL